MEGNSLAAGDQFGQKLRSARLNRRTFNQGLGLLGAQLAGVKLSSVKPQRIQPQHPSSVSRTQSNWLGVSFGADELNANTLPALSLAQGAGVGWLRIVFDWSLIEPSQGRFTWSGYDTLVQTAHSLGFQILGQISFVPQWNTTAPANLTPLWMREHYPPADYNLWQQHVQSVVARYKSAISVWEVWNEPDYLVFWASTPSEYAYLFSVSSQMIRQTDPNAYVAIGGLSLAGNPTQLNPNFLPTILNDPNYPATNNFDITSFHCYGSLAWAKSKVDYLKQQLSAVGVTNRPMWLTESGYASDPSQQIQTGYTSGPASQAQWLNDTFTGLHAYGVDRIFWFELYDCTANNPIWTVGLLDSTLTPKPILNTTRVLTATVS